jgi:hypothetical protein
MPRTKEARDQHVLDQILSAVGVALYPGDIMAMKYFVAERLAEIYKAK